MADNNAPTPFHYGQNHTSGAQSADPCFVILSCSPAWWVTQWRGKGFRQSGRFARCFSYCCGLRVLRMSLSIQTIKKGRRGSRSLRLLVTASSHRKLREAHAAFQSALDPQVLFSLGPKPKDATNHIQDGFSFLSQASLDPPTQAKPQCNSKSSHVNRED